MKPRQLLLHRFLPPTADSFQFLQLCICILYNDSNRQLSDSNTIKCFFYYGMIKVSLNTCGCIISNEISGHAHTNKYLPPLYSENKSLGTYCVQCIAKINNPISDLSTSSWRFFLFFHIAANNWQDWSITVLLGRDGLANSYQVL